LLGDGGYWYEETFSKDILYNSYKTVQQIELPCGSLTLAVYSREHLKKREVFVLVASLSRRQ
jgi:hypothetical protein